jgi:hypothetical protein
LRALPHHIVVGREFFAVLGAAVANFGANTTDVGMKIRVPQQEIRGGLAYLGTVQQQSEMIRVSVFTAFVQAVRHGFQTNVVTIGHDLYVMIGLMGHKDTSFVFAAIKRKKYAFRCNRLPALASAGVRWRIKRRRILWLPT